MEGIHWIALVLPLKGSARLIIEETQIRKWVTISEPGVGMSIVLKLHHFYIFKPASFEQNLL